MEARALGCELHEHRDRAVGLRAGPREQAVRDLALDHDRPVADARQSVQALHDQRRRDVVRQVRDELRRGGLERGEIEAERVAEHEIDVLATAKALGEMWLEPAVELDGVHARDSLGEVFGQNPQAGPDLEHDVFRIELREPADDAEDVVVDEEVLAELDGWVRPGASRERERSRGVRLRSAHRGRPRRRRGPWRAPRG